MAEDGSYEALLNSDLLAFNGLDGASGKYLVEALDEAGLRERARRLKPAQIFGSQTQNDNLIHRAEAAKPDRGLRKDYDPQKLSDAGWGLILPGNAEPQAAAERLAALDELLAWRRSQAGQRFKIYQGDDGYQEGESGSQFAARHGLQPGAVDPNKIPYYLLIAAAPHEIPFDFQYELDVQFAVGRVFFETSDEFGRYAHSIVTAEGVGAQARPERPARRERRAAFFGVANDDDLPTARSAEYLVRPLYEYTANQRPAEWGWAAELIPPKEAVKARLLELLCGPDAPDFLFSASHGLGWPAGRPSQLPFQGALVTQDWPGPLMGEAIPAREMYLGAEDIPDEAQLAGRMAFFFACFGAGTPALDDYAVAQDRTRRPLAERPFLAALPQRLLGHPRGGMLAVIGHVERAWGCSFRWGESQAEPETFKSLVAQILSGKPVGLALDEVNERYAQIAAQLTGLLEKLKHNPKIDAHLIASLWLANNDARGYAVVGDPAARLVF